MKRTFLNIVLLFTLSILNSQDLVYDWVSTYPDSVGSTITAFTTDEQGDLYISGTFQDTLILSDTTLYCRGAEDFFIAKMDSMGSLIWIVHEGRQNSEGIEDLAVFEGSLYAAGSFFESTMVGDTSLSSQGNADIFFVKYNTDGVFQWARRAGGDCVG